MSGLKGSKTLSVGNGSADFFHVGTLNVNNVVLGDDMKMSDTTLKTILTKLEEEIKTLKSEVSELRSKVDTLEVE